MFMTKEQIIERDKLFDDYNVLKKEINMLLDEDSNIDSEIVELFNSYRDTGKFDYNILRIINNRQREIYSEYEKKKKTLCDILSKIDDISKVDSN